MQKAQLNLTEIIDKDGKVDAAALPLLRQLVAQYPYYHAARMLMLRLLYQQRDSQYNEELRKAALCLPSRSKIYAEVEGDAMCPSAVKDEPVFTGATHARKRHAAAPAAPAQDNTDRLIGIFLNAKPTVLYDTQSGRPVDAATDYITYMLQEEALQNAAQQVQGTQQSRQEKQEAETSEDAPLTNAATAEQKDLVGEFITTQGDRRIRLSEKKDSELQKPTIDTETSNQQGAFTETLAKIYIKQGKFEQAIEIIRRLSLKYPKKNRYFADQIRFLEKLLLNSQS